MSSRAWCFTLNNYTKEEEDKVKEWECRYLVYGHEVGKKEKTPHLQGYVLFEDKKRLSAVKKLPGGERCHWETRRGSHDEAAKYCKKEDKEPFEKGTGPKQGSRSDIIDAKNTIKEGGTMRDIIETTASLQAIKYTEAIMKYIEPKKNWKPQVIWLWGEPGCGKTRTAYELMANYDSWTAPDSTLKWWDGYDGHKVVLIDELRDNVDFPYLLRILDRYEVQVQFKGGWRQLLAGRIIITSPHPPAILFQKCGENLNQLLRRIDYCIHVGHDPVNVPEVEVILKKVDLDKVYDAMANADPNDKHGY